MCSLILEARRAYVEIYMPLSRIKDIIIPWHNFIHWSGERLKIMILKRAKKRPIVGAQASIYANLFQFFRHNGTVWKYLTKGPHQRPQNNPIGGEQCYFKGGVICWSQISEHDNFPGATFYASTRNQLIDVEGLVESLSNPYVNQSLEAATNGSLIATVFVQSWAQDCMSSQKKTFFYQQVLLKSCGLTQRILLEFDNME